MPLKEVSLNYQAINMLTLQTQNDTKLKSWLPTSIITMIFFFYKGQNFFLS